MMYPYSYGRMNPYGYYYGYPRYGRRSVSSAEEHVSDDVSTARGEQVSRYRQSQSSALRGKQVSMSGQSQGLPLRDKEGNDFEKKAEPSCDDVKGDCEEKPVFEFFGLRLFSDDLLILAVLYFLYSEGVQDPELFIALVLLLLS